MAGSEDAVKLLIVTVIYCLFGKTKSEAMIFAVKCEFTECLHDAIKDKS